MTISVGDKIPSATLKHMTADGPAEITTETLTAGKKVVLFGLPGAFTPTCSAKHVPGYMTNKDALKAKGVDTIACISVNDAFVMGAWAKDQGTGGDVLMLGDGNGDLIKAMGLELDLTGVGLGHRGKRFAMVIDDGTVTALEVEPNPGELDVSSAENMLAKL